MKSLDKYTFPDDIKKMNLAELEEVSANIREFLVRKVSATGGHLSSNLGAVELTVALHKVFDSPKDKIIWDVGHQSYVHKILTGRVSGFDTLRKTDGMSGFPKQSESEHDIFDTGHASNSVSLALGLASARDLQKESFEVVAVIGDGSMTGGMAYEGMNNLGGMNSKVIIVLNDNGMSIEQSTGGLSRHLSRLRLSSNYANAKRNVKSALYKVPVIGPSMSDTVSHVKQSIKYAIAENGAFFEAFGIKYIGPYDGHDFEQIIEAFEIAKNSSEPVIVHLITKKGKGYSFAESEPDKFHGIGAFNPSTGDSGNSIDSFSNTFGRKLTDMALRDKRITAVCAAMIKGTGLGIFSETFPERTFNVGIAEAHAVSFAAGLAKQGLKPFVCIYSTFLQRAYDQIIQDVCLQKLPVIFAIDRAGIVGADGETHHGIFDISYLSSMPNMTILSPKNYEELELMMEYAVTLDGPCAIRYPRGKESVFPDEFKSVPLEYSKAQTLCTGKDVTIWAEGRTVNTAFEIFKILSDKGISCGIVNARFLSPLDKEKLISTGEKTPLICTLEDNILSGGFGEKIAALLSDEEIRCRVIRFGWPDSFIEHGSLSLLEERYGLDAKHISERILDIIERD